MIDTEHCGEEKSEGDEKRKERVSKIKFAGRHQDKKLM